MPETIQDAIRRAAAKYNVPEALALAVAEQESGFDPTKVNATLDESGKPINAVGTFQIIPGTAKMLGIDATDPRQNIDGGVRYLAQLKAQHNDVDKVLRAYGGVKTAKGAFYSPQVQARIEKFLNLPPLAPQSRVDIDTDNAAAIERAKNAAPTTAARVVGAVGQAGVNAVRANVGQGTTPQGAMTSFTPGETAAMERGKTAAPGIAGKHLGDYAVDLAKAHDPRTPQGRVNLAATAGSIGMMYATSGGSGVLPLLWRVAAPAIGAGVGGGGVDAVNQYVAKGEVDPRQSLTEGGYQAAADVAGQGIAYVPRKIAATAFGHTIAENARKGLQQKVWDVQDTGIARVFETTEANTTRTIAATEAERAANLAAQERARVTVAAAKAAARTENQQAADTAVTGVQSAVDAAHGYQSAVGASNRATTTATAANVTHAQITAAAQKVAAKNVAGEAKDAAVAAVKEEGATAVRQATQKLAEAAEAREAEAAEGLGWAHRAAALMQEKVPSITGLGRAVRNVVRGRPGVLPFGGEDAELGAATKAIKQVGESVRATAAAPDAPMLETGKVRAASDAMLAASTPDFVQQAAAAAEKTAASVTPEHLADVAKRFPMVKNPKNLQFIAERELVAAEVAEQGVNEATIPGIAGLMQRAPDLISFEDAHIVKDLLDQVVNWDRSAKSLREQLTKGVRGALRQTMREANHLPYEEANKAYQEQIRLYQRGVANKLINFVGKNATPDKVGEILSVTAPSDAAMIRKLLVEQSAAGGDAAAGQRAWNLLRDAWGHRNIAQGDIGGLFERVTKLTAESPEFAREMFGDAHGQSMLANYRELGLAYNVASNNYEHVLKQNGILGAAGKAEAESIADAALAAIGKLSEKDYQQALAAAQAAVDAQRVTAAARKAGTREANVVASEQAAHGVNVAGRAATAAGNIAKREAARAGRDDVAAAALSARESVETTATVGRQAVDAAQATGRADLAAAHATNRAESRAVSTERDEFMHSTLGRQFGAGVRDQQIGDIVRAVLLFGNNWGTVAAVRFFRSTNRADLIQWAKYSPTSTRAAAWVLTHPGWGRAWAGTIRALALEDVKASERHRQEARAAQAQGGASAPAAGPAPALETPAQMPPPAAGPSTGGLRITGLSGGPP